MLLSFLLLLVSLFLLITICNSAKCAQTKKQSTPIRKRLIILLKFATLTIFLALLPFVATELYGERMDGLWLIIIACAIVWISYIYDNHDKLGDTVRYISSYVKYITSKKKPESRDTAKAIQKASEKYRKSLDVKSYERVPFEQSSKFGYSLLGLCIALPVSIAISDSPRGSTD